MEKIYYTGEQNSPFWKTKWGEALILDWVKCSPFCAITVLFGEPCWSLIGFPILCAEWVKKTQNGEVSPYCMQTGECKSGIFPSVDPPFLLRKVGKRWMGIIPHFVTLQNGDKSPFWVRCYLGYSPYCRTTEWGIIPILQYCRMGYPVLQYCRMGKT